MQHDNGASVEEILESIKKVIARDNRTIAMGERRRHETGSFAETRQESAEADEADEVLDLRDSDLVEEVHERTAEEETGEIADEADSDPLTTATVRASMRENFAALAMLAEPGAQPQIVRSGETSLEGLAREMLRPMLAEWLDRNLPGMVERMVKAEIARIAGKRD